MLYNPPTGSSDPNAGYVGKNVAAGIQGSKIPPKAAEYPQREIVNALLGAGLSPTNSDTTQLLQAISTGINLGVLTGTANALAATLPGGVTIPALLAGMRFNAVVALNNTGATTFNLSGFASQPGPLPLVCRDGASALQSGDLTTNGYATFLFDGTRFRVASFVPSDIVALIQSRTRTLLRANVTIFIRVDANGANPTGRSNTVADAFPSLTAARDTVGNLYDTAGFAIIYTLGVAGSYPGVSYGVSSNAVIIDNVTGTKNESYIINCPTGQGSVIQSRLASLTVQNVKLDYTYNGAAQAVEAIVWAAPGGNITVNNCSLNCGNNRANLREFYADYNASIQCGGTIYSLGAGSRFAHHQAVNGGTFAAASGSTQTIFTSGGTIPYTGAFSMVADGGRAGWYNGVFTNFFASGSRYLADRLGNIDVAGQGENFLPGSAAGTKTNGGVYA